MSDHVGNGASGSSWRSYDSQTHVKQPKSSEINDFDAEQNNQSRECNTCAHMDTFRFDIEDLKIRVETMPKAEDMTQLEMKMRISKQTMETNVREKINETIENFKKREVNLCQEMTRTCKREIEQLRKFVFVIVFFFVILVLSVGVMSFQINIPKQEVKNGECVLGERCQYDGNDIIDSTSLYSKNDELLDKLSKQEKQDIVDSGSKLNTKDKKKPSKKSGSTSWDALKNSLFKCGAYVAAISFSVILLQNTLDVGHLKTLFCESKKEITRDVQQIESDTNNALEDTRKNIAGLQEDTIKNIADLKEGTRKNIDDVEKDTINKIDGLRRSLTSTQSQTNGTIKETYKELKENTRKVWALTTSREKKKRSGFFVDLDIKDELKVGTRQKINIFKEHFVKKSDCFNEKDCTYTAPVTGLYTLGGHLMQCGEGVLYLGCSIGIGWFSLLARTNSHNDLRKGMVMRRLEEGEKVYLHVERISGDATVAECGFFGHLLE